MNTSKHVFASQKLNVTREWDRCRDNETQMIRTKEIRQQYWVMSPGEDSHLSHEKDILHTFLEASPIVKCTAHTINLMSPGCQGCVSKCSYDYGCVRLSVSADWRRLIPIRDDCDPCDIIVPDVNHLTTSNQELHPVIDPGPTVRWPRLVQHSQILAAKYFRQTQLNISARRVFNTFSIKCRMMIVRV